MLFTTQHFALFLPLVFLAYWFIAKGERKVQNVLLLVASYYFYACWDYRFLFLLMFSTLLDFFTGLRIEGSQSEGWKKFWFWLSVSVNLGFLGVFKYYNFFAASFVDMLQQFGVEAHVGTLELILPVGISFYTFHGLSYVIDIYQGRIKPERNFVDYGLFVSFFPLLVAGPIERATHLLPQILKPRKFDYALAVDGCRQILWGIFKKVVIADGCAWYVNMIYNSPEEQSGSTLVMGAVLFTCQVYGDFSGYSDIALGVARLFGFELAWNFNFPLFSQNMSEFWRKWHISLSSWIRDYLFTPIAMEARYWGVWGIVTALMVSFTLNGLWHGANWTFVAWGALHGVVMSYEALTQKRRKRWAQKLPSALYVPASMVLTLAFWTFSLVLFRSPNLATVGTYIAGVFNASLLSIPSMLPAKLIGMIIFFFVVEAIGRKQQYGLQFVGQWKSSVARIAAYYVVILLILYFGTFGENTFIYFQF